MDYRAILAIWIIAILSTSTVSSAYGHVYLEAKLAINVMPGNGQTDEQINDMVKEINDILAQCGNISLTPVINRPDSFPDGFNHDADNEIISDGTTNREMVDAANPEIEHGGYKIFLAHSVIGSGGGESNGFTDVGKEISIIREQDGINGDGRTWAHEIGHGLGLSHRDPDSSDPNNLMYPDRERPDGTPTGTSLTEDQCETIRQNFLNLSPIVELTIDQMGLVPPPTTALATVLVSAEPVDPTTGETASGFGYVDAFATKFLFVETENRNELSSKIFLNGFLPRDEEVSARYSVYFDNDNNEETGMLINDHAGVDKIVQIDVDGIYPFDEETGTVSGTLMDTITEETKDLLHAEVFTHVRLDVSEEGIPQDDSIVFDVSLDDFGKLSDVMIVSMNLLTTDAVQTVEPFEVMTKADRPQTESNLLKVTPFTTVTLSGSGFAPDDSVTMYWNNNFNKVVTKETTDTNGMFESELRISETNTGNFLLDIIDGNHNIDIVVYTVIDKPRKQHLQNIPLAEIECRQDLDLVSSPSDKPACVISQTAKVLKQRGWTII
ncbi:hypothetical protein [Nitrosopumilus ureiphilus]|uniref:Uncharacterized protein n=1 Tax=Nitrosopumilus ureiphilus TaxID=1470067 RepID=A0A7D5M8L1_9ARCH|nr:hypothetical protein [Nitrosopumilus ureiphilus]QLH07190.1 hypothetical protein C5F50_08940 [Nitrosopumilus ureiphilus]